MEKTALDRVLGYIAARESRPIRQMDDCIHGIHAGEDFEGFLNYSDVKAVATALLDTVEALLDIAETCSPPGVPNIQYILKTATDAVKSAR